MTSNGMWRSQLDLRRDQLAFPFENRPALTGDDFLVADCNRDAVGWLDRWREWPAPVFVLHGPAGCGKTHLGQVFLAQTQGRHLRGQTDIAAEPARLEIAPAYLIEDADRDWSDIVERPLLHLYNWIAENDRRLLLTARGPVSRWGIKLADLRSRLLAAPSATIGAPDDALMAAVLVKLFADRQLRVEEDVVTYLLPRIERSFAAVRAIVAAVDAAALAEKRDITVPLVGRILGSMGPSSG